MARVGAVWVFADGGGGWSEDKKLIGTDAGRKVQTFGRSVRRRQ
jgi:hypothetical protein